MKYKTVTIQSIVTLTTTIEDTPTSTEETQEWMKKLLLASLSDSSELSTIPIIHTSFTDAPIITNKYDFTPTLDPIASLLTEDGIHSKCYELLRTHQHLQLSEELENAFDLHSDETYIRWAQYFRNYAFDTL